MKKLLLASAAFVVLPFAAQAADMAMPIVDVPGFTWTGAYVGVHAGYGWGDESDDQSDFFDDIPVLVEVDAADNVDLDGFIGGIHAGYNYQMNNFVFGVEGDLDYADISGNEDFDYDVGRFDVYGNYNFESDWQGSLRLRAGAVVMERTLVYATGGIAFAHGELDVRFDGIMDDPERFSDSNTHIGYTIGGGIEHAFTDKLIGRLEARYTDFSSEDYDIDGDDYSVDWDQITVNVGLSLKF